MRVMRTTMNMAWAFLVSLRRDLVRTACGQGFVEVILAASESSNVILARSVILTAAGSWPTMLTRPVDEGK